MNDIIRPNPNVCNVTIFRALERRAPRSAAPERRSEKQERGRSATPKIVPERKSERNSEKGRSASWSARSDYYAKPNYEMTFIKEKKFLAQARKILFFSKTLILTILGLIFDLKLISLCCDTYIAKKGITKNASRRIFCNKTATHQFVGEKVARCCCSRRTNLVF